MQPGVGGREGGEEEGRGGALRSTLHIVTDDTVRVGVCPPSFPQLAGGSV